MGDGISTESAESRSIDNNCCQLKSIADNCGRNPIQYESNPNTESQSKPKPKTRAGARERERFERFWLAYPRKRNKGAAERTFFRLGPTEELTQSMIAAIEAAKKRPDWQKEGGRFVPFPATWLNARGWEDDDETSIDHCTGHGAGSKAAGKYAGLSFETG